MNPFISLLALLAGIIAGAGITNDYWQLKHAAQVAELTHAYQQQAATAQANYHTALTDQLQASKAAERSFLTKQQTLNQHRQQLQEQLNEATANPACTLSPDWVQHYRQALGVSATVTTHSNGAGDSRSAADAAITTAELLRHASEYGHWCQSNLNQLTALQHLMKGQPHDHHEHSKWTH